MKNSKTWMQIFGFVLLSLGGTAALAQSTTTVMIPINNQIFEKLPGDDLARVNLIKEAQKINPGLGANLEVQMIRVEAKSGVGGAQVFLRVNNQMMDSKVVETDPDQLNSIDPKTFDRVELKNIDRAAVNEASLVMQSFSNIRIRSLELILGAVQEPVIFGKYANDQVGKIGGGVTAAPKTGRPSAETLAAIYNRYYASGKGAPAPAVAAASAVATKPVAGPVATAPATVGRNCVVHVKGFQVCVGDTIKNQWDFPGLVLAVDTQTRVISAKFEYSTEPLVRNVDTFKK